MTDEELLKKIEERKSKKSKGLLGSISNYFTKLENSNNNIKKKIDGHIDAIEKQEKERRAYLTEIDKQEQVIANIENPYRLQDVKKEISNSNRKEKYKKQMKENSKKGLDYEKFVGEHFESLGCIVKFNGIEKGKKDNSIDLIAINKDEIIFIQCKNWKQNSKYKINHEKIKSFVGDTYVFIEENINYSEYKIKRLFVASNEVFDASAKMYCKEHKNVVQYMHLPIEEIKAETKIENIEVDNIEEVKKLTTSKLATKHKMKTNELNEFFVKTGYLEKKEKGYYLTQKGKDIGGVWKSNKFGGYILWNEDTILK